jgi:uncharacterized protein
MGLEERLRRMRGAPLASASSAGAPETSLRERLAHLRPGAALREPLPWNDAVWASPRPPLSLAAGLDVALGGRWVAPGVLLVERRVSLAQGHGSVALGAGLRALGDLSRRILGQVGDPSGWCLLDTETSGLAGGTGTWVFACGLGRAEGEALVLRQYLLARLDAESAFLAALTQALTGCELLVSYNGKSFDLPLLATRLRLAGLRTEFDRLAHLDLLHPIRRAFAPVWADCCLGTAEVRLLGLRRQGDLLGSEAPRAWLDWLRLGQTAGLAGVLGHNRLDLLSMAALPAPLNATLTDPARTGADPLAVAGWHRDRGDPERAREILEVNRQGLTPAGLLELARNRSRAGDWDGARALWEPLAEAGHLQAIGALARLWEHRLGAPERALAWASRLPAGEDRERRCRRIAARLARLDGAMPRRPGRPSPAALQQGPEELPGIGLRTGGDVFRGPDGDDQAAPVAALGAQVDDPVGGLDHVQVVLDDHEGVALVAQAVQDV